MPEQHQRIQHEHVEKRSQRPHTMPHVAGGGCLASNTALPSMGATELLPTVQAHLQQQDLAELPARLIEYLQVSAAGTSQQAMQHSLPARVSLVKGAVLCSRYDWSPHHAILETVGATASFYVAEYFDNVAEYFDNVAVAADERGRLWYA